MIIIQFNHCQISGSDSQTSKTSYESYEGASVEEVEYALERAYEGCNYISSIEEVSSITGESPVTIAANFAAGKVLSTFDRVDTTNWEESFSYYWS